MGSGDYAMRNYARAAHPRRDQRCEKALPMDEKARPLPEGIGCGVGG